MRGSGNGFVKTRISAVVTPGNTRPRLEGRQSDTSSYSLLQMYATFLELALLGSASLEPIAGCGW